MNACPVCSTSVAMMLTGSPYRLCEACGTACQSPASSSWRSSDDRPANAPMPERDREVNLEWKCQLLDLECMWLGQRLRHDDSQHRIHRLMGAQNDGERIVAGVELSKETSLSCHLSRVDV